MTSSGHTHALFQTPIAGLVSLALRDPALADLTRRATERPGELALVGPASARLYVAAALAQVDPLLVVTATGREADDLTAELRGVFGDAAALFPSWETLPHERLSPGVDTVGARLMLLRRLSHPDDARLGPPLRVVVTTARSLLQPMTPDVAKVEPVMLQVGAEIGFEQVVTELVELAYTRVDMVGKRGEFAVRGGILDVFAPTAEHPVRVEFWGDEVSEMRMFSVADQRSIPEIELDTLVAVACRELLLTEDVRARAAALAGQASTAEGHITGTVGEMLAKLAEGIPVDGMEALLPVLRPDDLALLTDQLPAGTPVLVCDPEKVRTRASDLIKTGQEFLEASWSVAAVGGDAPIDVEQLGGSGFRELAEVRASARDRGHPWWTLSQLSDGAAVELDIRPAPSARGSQHSIDELFAMLRAHVATGGHAAIVAPGTGTAHRVVEQLAESETPAAMLDPGAVPRAGVVGVLKGPLHDGVVLPGANLVVITETDLTGNRVTGGEGKRLAAKRRNTVDPLALSAGDLVVHDQHGIGRFVEMVERTVGGARREYLVLEYGSSRKGSGGNNTDKLFVPMDSLDQLSRYVGGEAPSLSRLGGSDWANTKTKARKAVREIAGELVSLYAKRQAAPGHAFGPDTPWQSEMEDAFGFTETVDQLTAITEVKADMEKPVPMDRVICGDVGYGKTEIGVRAAFKAVQDGKQVAVLVPTTLLADQHLQTFSARMAGFPVTVKALSRFTDPAESRAVLEGMADGGVDIVIGTHRLLQTGVRWKDLGLVIVDEEQRFGVEHKEHIKAMRTHVDVLTMSATPIPRTLEMSLAGIREMSTILTPPEERYPVLTYVGPHDDKQVAAALRRELLRDGQVFYIHNRVRSIDQAAARVRALVPEARVVVAHGQMPEEQLERTVEGFWNREFDILVCTTIVETGLDISNANTLIVERADTFGLSQLHQLRGRVGRSRERGYAYFLYPPEVPLTETAHDRLVTIAQNNELGAGMAVALKDLEIRGAGNVLGVEQSGHVAGVGFDLYVRLVGEAVEAYRAAVDGKTVATQEEPQDVRIDLPVDAHLPPDYIASDRLRLEAYRRLAAAADAAAVGAVVDELIDRYGPLPEPAHRLVAVARLRLLCREYRVTEISAMSAATVRLAPLHLPDSAQLRLKRLYPGANYRATASTVQVPIPRAGNGVGAPRIRDVELVQMVAGLILTLHGKPQDEVDMAQFAGAQGLGEKPPGTMTVVLVDPRRPSLVPVEAIELLAGDVQYTEELPVKVRWALPAARPVSDGPGAPVLLSSDRAHPAVQARVAAGAKVIGAPGPQPGERLVEAVAIMDKLRTTGPWESEQTHDSLRRYLLEETYELFDAVHSGDADELREELGDVLLQVLFHARIAEDAPEHPFSIDDVADALVRKLGNRVPAVLAGESISLEDQLAQWEERKALEKTARTSIMDGVPTGQPALALAQKVISRASQAGVPADLLPPGMVQVTLVPDADAENELRSTALAFIRDIREAEKTIAVNRLAELHESGPAGPDEWRAAWPSGIDPS